MLVAPYDYLRIATMAVLLPIAVFFCFKFWRKLPSSRYVLYLRIASLFAVLGIVVRLWLVYRLRDVLRYVNDFNDTNLMASEVIAMITTSILFASMPLAQFEFITVLVAFVRQIPSKLVSILSCSLWALVLIYVFITSIYIPLHVLRLFDVFELVGVSNSTFVTMVLHYQAAFEVFGGLLGIIQDAFLLYFIMTRQIRISPPLQVACALLLALSTCCVAVYAYLNLTELGSDYMLIINTYWPNPYIIYITSVLCAFGMIEIVRMSLVRPKHRAIKPTKPVEAVAIDVANDKNGNVEMAGFQWSSVPLTSTNGCDTNPHYNTRNFSDVPIDETDRMDLVIRKLEELEKGNVSFRVGVEHQHSNNSVGNYSLWSEEEELVQAKTETSTSQNVPVNDTSQSSSNSSTKPDMITPSEKSDGSSLSTKSNLHPNTNIHEL